jgi:hypothetical protein
MRKNQHITHNKNGGWNVLGAGNTKPSRILPNKAEAIAVGREIAKHQHSELIIHGVNGRIQDKDSYGKDSYPPKDMIH